jgi:hypothetical protein
MGERKGSRGEIIFFDFSSIRFGKKKTKKKR